MTKNCSNCCVSSYQDCLSCTYRKGVDSYKSYSVELKYENKDMCVVGDYDENANEISCTDVEDKLRILLANIFSLNPLELLTLQQIMLNKSLTEGCRYLNSVLSSFNKQENLLTRFHIFQLRKQIYKKIPELKSALLTKGQRKELKDE